MLSSISKYKNLNQFICDAMERFAKLPSFSCLGQTVTFEYIDKKSTALAAYYQSLGLQAGDRIAIQLPNLIQYPIATYAAFKAGLIVVNTNPFYTPREMKHQFNDSGAKAIVILTDLYPTLAEIYAETLIEYVIVTDVFDLISGGSEISNDKVVSFNYAIKKGEALPLLSPNAMLDDVAILQYTGGTTGVSKGAQLTHRNLIANTFQASERLGEYLKEGQEVFVCPLPLYHIYALMVNMLLIFSKGNLNVLIPNPRDYDAFIDAIEPFSITGFSGINTLFVGLCNQSKFRQLDFSKLRLTLSGGTALTSTAASIWRDVTGCNIAEGFGLSETSPVVTLSTPGSEEIGTVGFPVIGTDVEFWDENDVPVPDGKCGQIVVRGEQVMKGYWNMPEQTAEVMTAEGFFKTGDIGLRLSNGHIKIVDRLKDMIIVSGFNVYPNEIEEILVSHPAVLEAAVVGKADEKTGESVHAYVTLKSTVEEKDIILFCREKLTNYKVPKKVTIMEKLPKSTVGKTLRRALRK
ncbi:long-chain fatty acid--CoA ligase [Pseudoalteromonas sp. GCY]|uniref:AMP-binding protein n=1 Tax=Pseudoalteromonas sp. GCY TaxID=2003316 RepID=UPI000BFED269|nr:AMP-binding protein [Pseudoalteromonas sp. GCY]PHI37501.1 long-chain fatty acid--CoA ligase [Pseudoalteromonas sp. GCY]QQQ64789.1 AMP-binding protein [Pseudoalteromonas sp. GCY]